ncbi:hypothetical protein PFICI_08922 [Pestalotiopsis fici W106-1]|uniref:Uncharacterized protein n=1 Tax=Pestalotiopsis fici (strain W106-1 / CGMCC3.15140) TaxID=1229662 RepID=W3WZ60_PESFW|nr:uncharacterized protein PFICI_08922 [Pestalotiopsis fici W106-1]ETS79069.1 hypothetical protein PFICI_08922 [Pestalotiopsis fici W106-1]
MSALTPKEAALQLRKVLQLLTTAINDIASRWESESRDENAVEIRYNGTTQHTAQDPVKVALAAMGHVESLITEPHRLVVDMSTSYLISRALHIVADHDIAGIIAAANGADGVHVEELARLAGMEQDKLCRIMRALVSHHVFQEVEERRFANNHVSETLAGDPAFRAHIMMKGRVHYAASDHLPSIVKVKGSEVQHDSEARKTAFQKAVRTDLSLFDWMNQEVPAHDTDWRPRLKNNEISIISYSDKDAIPGSPVKTVARPEKLLFHQAMAGLDRGQGHFYLGAYPWRDLGTGTVVDVGGGIGSFCMQLHDIYPALQLVVQDREPVIKQAISVWQSKYPEALNSGQVKLSVHDFFMPNPVQGADVYWLRYILHDWPDNQVATILGNIAKSMTASSRLLIADIIVTTTVRTSLDGDASTAVAAPPPLLANYGQAAAHAHLMDLNMMMMVNGRERTPAELAMLVQATGLEIVRIWQGCAADALGVVECRLAV